jgi:PKHD-type hydroxylase
MRGEWCYFKSHFTPDECNTILQIGLTLPEQDATIGVEGAIVDKDVRKSKIRFIQKNDIRFEWLFDRLWKMAVQANDEWFNFNVSKITYLQLAEYDSSYLGEYKIHKDVFWVNTDPKYHRKLSCIVQLSDPATYEGGNFELHYLSTSYPDANEIRQQGSAIFLPAFIDHAATPVTSGKRYSLAAWFDGPKWT